MPSSPLRMLVIAGHDLWGSSDQPERAPGETMKYFISHGVELTLISCEAKNARYSEIGAKVIIAGTGFRKFSKRRLWTVAFSMIIFPMVCFWTLIRNRKLIGRPDVIYSYETISVAAGCLLSWMLQTTLVNRFQGTILSDVVRHARWSFARIKRIDHIRALSSPADLVVMTDDGTSGDAVLRVLNPRQRFVFLRNGFKFDGQGKTIETTSIKERMNLSDSHKVFMTLSRLVSWKRVDRAILAFSHYYKRNPNISLVIIGDGSGRADLEGLVSQLQLNSNIHFLGMVPHSQVAGLIRQCNVFLTLFDLSNLGNPLFEAMLNARPIITLPNGETRSVIKDRVTGYFAESEDPESIAKVMQWVIENYDEAVKVGQNAENWARSNLVSWSDRLKVELEAIKDICEVSKRERKRQGAPKVV